MSRSRLRERVCVDFDEQAKNPASSHGVEQTICAERARAFRLEAGFAGNVGVHVAQACFHTAKMRPNMQRWFSLYTRS